MWGESIFSICAVAWPCFCEVRLGSLETTVQATGLLLNSEFKTYHVNAMGYPLVWWKKTITEMFVQDEQKCLSSRFCA